MSSEKRIPEDHDLAIVWPTQWTITSSWGVYAGPYAALAEAETSLAEGRARYSSEAFQLSLLTVKVREERRIHGEDALCGYEEGDTYHPEFYNRPFWAERKRGFMCEVWSPAGDRKVVSLFTSPENACRGVRTKMKIGRYLKRYFGEVLSETEIAMLAQWQTEGQRPSASEDLKSASLRAVRNREGFSQVYQNGPNSCMSGANVEHVEDPQGEEIHPCEVYAAGDLALAYLQDDAGQVTSRGKGAIFARALIWPGKKVYGRVYPTEYNWAEDGFENGEESRTAADELRRRLEAKGYTSYLARRGAFDGARLLYLPTCDSSGDEPQIIMPYLDGNYGFSHTFPGSDSIVMERGGQRGDDTCGQVDDSGQVFGGEE